MVDPTVIADYDCELGENPVWDPARELLYWCDIERGRIYRYDPASDEHAEIHDGTVVGGFTLQSDGSLLLFEEGGRIELWEAGSTTTVVDGIAAEADSRFNDVVADPRGRVFCETMPTEDRGGRLYRLDADASLTELDDGYDIPNGMDFSPDEETMYVVESMPALVYAFDYEAETGALSNRRVFADTSDQPGLPDGLTVDAEGYVWTARWNGGSLVRYTPGGEVDAQFDLPVRYPTSLAFGGPGFGDLYVTTCREDGDASDPLAGALFRLTPPARGRAAYRSDVSV